MIAKVYENIKDNSCELVVGIHINNPSRGGKLYKNDFCINVCNEHGITIADALKHCTKMKKEGRLKRNVDENQRVFYTEVI